MVCASSWITSQPEMGTVLRRMVQKYLFLAHCPSLITISSWAELTGVIRFEATIVAEWSAENFILCSTSLSPMPTFSSRATVAVYHSGQSRPSGYSWQLNSLETIVVDKGLVGMIRTLPLHHYPTTVTEEDPIKKAKHKSAWCHRCYSRSKRSTYTWYCHECQLWLCYTGELHTDCLKLWHAQQNKISSVLLIIILSTTLVWHPMQTSIMNLLARGRL